MPKRCALGCPPLGVPMHAFPQPDKFPETFKAWVAIVEGKLETTKDYEFYRTKKICDIHFTDDHKNRNHRLNALAVPTLCLPDISMKNVLAPHADNAHVRPALSSIENIIDCPINVAAPTPTETFLDIAEFSTSLENLTGPADILIPSIDDVQPSTSKEYPCFQPHLDLNTSTSEPNIKGPEDDVQPSTSKEYHNFQPQLDLNPSMSEENINATSSVLKEHNYCKQKCNKAIGVPTFKATKIHRSSASKKLYEVEMEKLRRKINQLTHKNLDFKKRIENAVHLNNDIAFRRIVKNMTPSAKLFTKMQWKQTKKRPSGRRFTLEEKILSLTIFKRGARVYNLLSRLFTLPSTKTLRALLSKIKIGTGVNDIIFEKIEKTVENMNVDDKLCTLMFDEMSLTPQLHYDRANDKIKGFTDFEDKKIADHVLVFMIKGVKANYKQPVAYYFTNSVNKFQLKKCIKEVVIKLQSTGLTVLCTVCDQGSANVGAISELVQESKNIFLRQGKAWRDDFFEINGKKIIPLFDVPHLLKGLRNNLLNKDLKYTDFNDNDKEKTVKWDYFLQVYKADKCLGELKSLHKITEEHLIPEKIKKMRVKNAAQILSHSVAVVTDHLVARKLIDSDCQQLVPFVNFVDKLFDSLNSSTFHIPDGKIYKGCVRRTSPHHLLWQNAIKMFKSMKFFIKRKCGNKVRLTEAQTPTIKNFIKTIAGMQGLWRVLSVNYGFDSMLTRNFNQDPLENFFGNIRSYGVRNVAPNCTAFEGAYKSLLLNNFSSTHSLYANCEKDNFECLQNLKFFLSEKTNSLGQSFVSEEDDVVFREDVLTAQIDEDEDVGQINYVCGWVLTKCLKTVVKGCKTCKENLLCRGDRRSNELIKAKEYNKKKKWLVYPSEKLELAFKEVQNLTVCTLKKDVPTHNLKKQLKLMADTLVYFPCTCNNHFEKLKNMFINTTIIILIYSWCRSINRILSGKISYDGEDEMKIIAQDYYKRHVTNRTKK